MTEPKPIAVIYFRAQGLINEREIPQIQEALEGRWTDYHVLVVPAQNQERVVELEVYYDKNFTDTNYEDLKKWISEYINLKSNPNT